MMRRVGLGVIFACSPAGPWVPCVVLHPLVDPVSGLSEREVRQKDRSVWGFPSRSLTLMDCGGVGSVALARDTCQEWVRSGHRPSVRALKHGFYGFQGWPAKQCPLFGALFRVCHACCFSSLVQQESKHRKHHCRQTVAFSKPVFDDNRFRCTTDFTNNKLLNRLPPS